MTELYIDGTSVILPQDFSIQVKRENPIFTKNGEYTYDITLPLDNPVNARVYGHLNRLNTLRFPSTGRKAVLIADGRVYCNGTELITGWTDRSVSIQVAGGNSELNYIAGGDTLVSDLDFDPFYIDGVTPGDGATGYVYPESGCCYPTVTDRTSGRTYNEWQYIYSFPDDALHPRLKSPTLPQPYLCTLIKAVTGALGYKLVRNQLDESDYKYLFVCNVSSIYWRDLLPGWKVLDFLEEIERMFNATFVIDNRRRTAQLLRNGSYFAGAGVQHVTQPDDGYEAETGDDNPLTDYAATRIAYNLPASDYWKLNCLDDGYISQADPGEIPETYDPDHPMTGRAFNWLYANAAENTLYADPLYSCYHLVSNPKGGTGEDSLFSFYILDRFAPANRLAEEELTLHLVPAEMGHVSTRIDFPAAGGNNPATLETSYLKAIVDNSPSPQGAADNRQEIEKILDWEDPATPTSGNVTLAFYNGGENGSATVRGTEYTWLCPNPFIDTYNVSGEPVHMLALSVPRDTAASLRPAALAENFYRSPYDISYDKAVKITAYDPAVYLPTGIFEIGHRHYLCREMEYTLDAGGRKGPWTGTFYPIRLDVLPGGGTDEDGNAGQDGGTGGDEDLG